MNGVRPFSKMLSLPAAVFLLVRGALLLALPYEGLRAYGDFAHFYALAELPGLPYFQYWSEFPPLFPFLSELIYALAGKEHVYTYLLVLLLTAADFGSLLLAGRMARRFEPRVAQPWRPVFYAAILAGLAYSWWYFDAFAVFFTLLALEWAFSEKHPSAAGLVLGLGILTKLFPALLLPALWKTLPRRRAAWVTATAVGLTLAVYGGLLAASPQFAWASLRSQAAKGSWETPWALLDGNLRTGNFGAEIERLDPAAALRPVGNPPRISPWLTLIPFAGLGLFLFLKARPSGQRGALIFYGLTAVVFFLWSPGWSVQWVLMLLPAVLLGLPEQRAGLMAGALVFANLLEWPLLLSRGMFFALPLTILLRVLLLALLGLMFWQSRED